MSEPATGPITTDKLFEDLQAVVRDAEALLSATAGQLGDGIRDARQKAEQSVRQARARLGDFDLTALDGADEAIESADRFVREKPWQAIGIAAGIGLLVGLIVSRR